ncbi:MAG: hypothetical protein J6Y29_01585 [Clostridiales bacterium]|nr:hypothetical protein [Clostridiales bacterium]
MKKKSIKDQIADLSNYGLIYACDLKDLAKKLNKDPQELEDIALDMGFNVEGLFDD